MRCSVSSPAFIFPPFCPSSPPSCPCPLDLPPTSSNLQPFNTPHFPPTRALDCPPRWNTPHFPHTHPLGGVSRLRCSASSLAFTFHLFCPATPATPPPPPVPFPPFFPHAYPSHSTSPALHTKHFPHTPPLGGVSRLHCSAFNLAFTFHLLCPAPRPRSPLPALPRPFPSPSPSLHPSPTHTCPHTFPHLLLIPKPPSRQVAQGPSPPPPHSPHLYIPQNLPTLAFSHPTLSPSHLPPHLFAPAPRTRTRTPPGSAGPLSFSTPHTFFPLAFFS